MDRKASLVVALGALAMASAGAFSPLQAKEPAKAIPRTAAQASVRTIAPRAATSATLAKKLAIDPATIHNLPSLKKMPVVFEFESWGDNPELGLSVQDMTGFGSEWSGNKQIFWNPQPAWYAFKWDFTTGNAQWLQLYLTTAPDYGSIRIILGCYSKLTEHYYKLDAQRYRIYEGHASKVGRKSVAFPIATDPACKDADMYRLEFHFRVNYGGKFGGLDSLVIHK